MAARAAVLPVLRWAGGKRWLMPRIPEVLRDLTYNAYHEPFLGGASVFLGLAPPGAAYLSDLNAELIETYEQVRDDADAVADRLALHVNTSEHYYNVRASRPVDPAKRAARFIYLNQTSFNGVHRVNLKGEYNVPFGWRPSPKIPDREHLRALAGRLEGVHLWSGDFEECLINVKEGDLVFLDPPYTVAHNHNGFVKYNQHLFSFADQGRLSSLIDRIRTLGAFYVMTNAAHASIAQLFDKGERRLSVRRRNVVGGTAAERGTAMEYLFTNAPHA